MHTQNHTPKLNASAVVLALALAACGPHVGAPGADVSESGACALIADPAALFGADVLVEPGRRQDEIASTCRFTSADGRRFGEILLMDKSTLDAVTPGARLAEALKRWSGMTHTPLAPVEGLGDEAQIALDMSGYQTQIGFRKGEAVVFVLGNSGDAKMTGEAIARALAKEAAAKAP